MIMLIKNCKIHISLSVILLLIISLYSGFIKDFLIIFLSIIIHELFHIVFVLIYKGNIKKIHITLFGGIVSINKSMLSLHKKVIIDIIGVIANLLIIIIFIVNKSLFIRLLTSKYYYFTINYNVIMIIFNMIPLEPLDGNNLLKDIILSIYDIEYGSIILNIVHFITFILLFVIIIFMKLYCLLLINGYLLYLNIFNNTKEEYMITNYYLLHNHFKS